jgi:hypothetical protein
VLVALDTLIGVLFGRNQLQSAVWELTIADLHWSLYRVMEDIRVGLAKALASAIEGAGTASDADHPVRFHVSISAESDDGRSLYYITSDQGRSSLRFPMKSMAWLSVALGQPRWWLKSYDNHQSKIVVYDKESVLEGVLTVEPVLANLWQLRPGSDYEAFIVLPAPRRRPGGAPDAGRRGAVHISCSNEKVFRSIWRKLPTVLDSPASGDPAFTGDTVYDDADTTAYNIENVALKQTLETAVATLGHALERFNETTFDTYILRCRRPERS